jgi:hypothetical protein
MTQMIKLDAITNDEVLLLGQKLKRPERVSVQDWKGFWKGYARRNVRLVRSACEPFEGIVVARPNHVLVPDWVDFWQRRATNDLRVHA